jgi:hypothetical protein
MATSIPTRRSDGRFGRSLLKKLIAELSRPDESVPKETTFTENVSTRGTRVTTVRRWQRGTRVLLTFLRDGIRSEGKVAYCQRKESGDFAIGVDLSGQLQSRVRNLT